MSGQRISGERLYWGVVEVPGVGGTPSAPVALLDREEEWRAGAAEQIPCELDDLHVVAYGIGSDRVVVIATEIDDLRRQLQPDAMELIPTGVPAAVQHAMPELAELRADRLNLLCAEFEPAPLRQIRESKTRTWIAGLVCAALLLTLGIELRRASAGSSVDALLEANTRLLTQVGAPSRDALMIEVARLTAAHRVQGSGEKSAGALLAMQSVLNAWPRGDAAPRVRTESMQATPDSVVLSLTTETRSDASQIIEALKNVAGWTLQQPQMTSVSENASGAARGGDGVRLNLRLNRRPPSSGGAQ